MTHFDTIILGAGAAGLMCAIEAGKRQRNVLVIEKSNKPGRKILMSGGGRCNFTNLDIQPEKYISHNPHFSKSALARYTQWDFIDMVKDHNIPFHEKKLGQLFCDNKAKDILDMLLNECEKHGVKLQLNTSIHHITKEHDVFILKNQATHYTSDHLVIATGGLSIPSMGSSPFAYQLAKQFDIKVYPTSAGLVPLTLGELLKEQLGTLSGIAVPTNVSNKHITFNENILFTHRGLSGPAILQLSSYWTPGESIAINLLPQLYLYNEIKAMQRTRPNYQLKSLLCDQLPQRLVEALLDQEVATTSLAQLRDVDIQKVENTFQHWKIKPVATEGYRTAEVTLGGIDCNALSSKTMESKSTPGLYFIGEAVDVTGWLGGYNFQWAWSSGWVAGQYC